MSKTITQEEFYVAKGLFTLAVEHRNKVDDLDKIICARLGLEHNMGSHISDAIWGGDRGFEDAMEREKISVSEPSTTTGKE